MIASPANSLYSVKQWGSLPEIAQDIDVLDAKMKQQQRILENLDCQNIAEWKAHPTKEKAKRLITDVAMLIYAIGTAAIAAVSGSFVFFAVASVVGLSTGGVFIAGIALGGALAFATTAFVVYLLVEVYRDIQNRPFQGRSLEQIDVQLILVKTEIENLLKRGQSLTNEINENKKHLAAKQKKGAADWSLPAMKMHVTEAEFAEKLLQRLEDIKAKHAAQCHFLLDKMLPPIPNSNNSNRNEHNVHYQTQQVI